MNYMKTSCLQNQRHLHDAFSAANILKIHKEVLGLFYRFILCQENSASITLFRSLYHGKQNLITESE